MQFGSPFGGSRRHFLRNGAALLGASSAGMLAGATGVNGASRSNASVKAPSRAAPGKMPLGALVSDSFNAWRWGTPGPGNTWNVLDQLKENGVEWLRMWNTTRSFPELRTNSNWFQLGWKDGYWSCLEVAGEILRLGAEKGFRLQALLFVNDQSAAAGGQPMPAAWAGLSESALRDAIRASSAATAAYYKSLGLNIEVFEIGNEIDFGFVGRGLGVTATPPLGTDWTTNMGWMHDNVWGPMAPLLQAGIEGVKSVYPDAQTLLHIAGFGYNPGELTVPAFFQSMTASGVTYDKCGLSYPYMFVPGTAQLAEPYFQQPVYQNALSALVALGKPVQVVEFDYPASPDGQVHQPGSLYPFTEQGQENFVRDFAALLLNKGVERLFYWYPDYYPGMLNNNNPELCASGLFSAKDVARPALKALKQISGVGLSQTDCLFNWAELNYRQFFPAAGGTAGTYGAYTYRYYATTQNYLAVSSQNNHVYVMGASFGSSPVDVGAADGFLAAASCLASS
jgi:arabinogalactan endo-1,4-beta-galactosidase